MILLRLSEAILKRIGMLGFYRNYKRSRMKVIRMRINVLFLERCLKNRLIPHFLKFKIPENGTFAQSCVDNFQRKLLKIEFSKSKESPLKLTEDKDINLTKLESNIPEVLIPSIAKDRHKEATKIIQLLEKKYNKKLNILSEEQNKPVFNINESVKLLDVGIPLPLGPRSPVLDRFDKKDVLAEIDSML